MKQIQLLQGKVLLIELPEGAKDIDIFKASYGQQLMYTDKFDCGLTLDPPPGNWRIIGVLSEVTEEQTADLAEAVGYVGHDTDTWPVFKDYNDNQDGFLYALESLESAILAEGWYFENPLENERKKIGLGTLDNFDQDYEQAQSRVLDRSRCLLLGRDN